MFLVTGATGDLGRRIVKIVRRRGMAVRVFVRLQSEDHGLEHSGAEVFVGDLRSRESIERAVRGAKYVISAHGSTARSGRAAEVDYQANIDLIDAATAHGVEHFVYISVLGADRYYKDAPIFKAKYEVEQYLLRSSLFYTILRPCGFASNLLGLARTFERTGLYLLIGRSDHRTSIVSTDDLGEIAVQAPITHGARNRIFEVGGPEPLRRDEIPRIFEKLFNRTGQLLHLPLEVFDGVRAFIGLFNQEAVEDLGNLRVLLANEYTCDPGPVRQTFGIELESLHHFLKRNLHPLA